MISSSLDLHFGLFFLLWSFSCMKTTATLPISLSISLSSWMTATSQDSIVQVEYFLYGAQKQWKWLWASEKSHSYESSTPCVGPQETWWSFWVHIITKNFYWELNMLYVLFKKLRSYKFNLPVFLKKLCAIFHHQVWPHFLNNSLRWALILSTVYCVYFKWYATASARDKDRLQWLM